jgi:hypothetical protein
MHVLVVGQAHMVVLFLPVPPDLVLETMQGCALLAEQLRPQG